MNRQYIGARYVPRFVGEWNATTKYEALDVVDNGMGTSYIAKIPVPVGTPLTNTTYWVVYGASSGAILDLQSRVSAIEGEIPTINSDIDNLEDEVEVLKGVGRLWYIGDSFLGLTNNWGNKLDTYLGKTNSYYTDEGGIGFVNLGNTSALNLAGKVMTLTNVPTDIDIAIVVAGCNDCKEANISQIDDGIANLITAIKTKVPNIRKILFAFNGTYQGTAYSDYANRINYVGDVYRIIANQVALYPKCGFMRSVASQLQSSIVLEADSVHPNAVGSELIAKAIKNHLMGCGDVTINFRRQVGMFDFDICNLDYVSVSCVTGGSMSVSNVNVGAYTYTKLGNLALPYYPRFTNQIRVPFQSLTLISAGGDTRITNGHILITSNGDIHLYSHTAVNSVTSAQIGSGDATITVPMFVQLH